MSIIKLVIASLLIPIGFLFGLAIATEYINPNGTGENKSSILTAGILIGLPAIVIGTGLIGQEYTEFSRKLAAKQRRIDAIFTDLLAQNNGIISLTLFVQRVNLSVSDAQRFLDRKLTLHPGSFKHYKDGKSYYCFNQSQIKNKI